MTGPEPNSTLEFAPNPVRVNPDFKTPQNWTKMLKQWSPDAKTCCHVQKRWFCLGLSRLQKGFKERRSWGLDLGRGKNKEEEEELGFEGKVVRFVGCSCSCSLWEEV
ncbi:unnamed protein product [Prunus armeniaca]